MVQWKTETRKCQKITRNVFIDLEDKEFKETIEMLARNWKHKWLPLCFVRQARRVSMGRPMVRPMISTHNLRISWKPVNPQNCGWKDLYQIIMRTILQERWTIHCNITIWYTNLFLCLKPWRFPQQKQQWKKNGRKLEKIPAWDLTKVRSKKEVIDEARTKGAKVHAASLMDICHLKNAELETKHLKYKGRVVFRACIVGDDSGSYAVFMEHIISRLPGWAGQATDAVSAYTQVKMEDGPKFWKIPESECPDICYHDTNGLDHGLVSKTRSFFSSGIGTATFWLDCYGKGNLMKSYKNTVRRRFPIENACSYIEQKGLFLSVFVDDT